MKKILASLLFFTTVSFAATDIAVPDLNVDKGYMDAPLTIYQEKTRARASYAGFFGAGSQDYSHELTIITTERLTNAEKLNNQTISNLGMFVSAIRGALVKSGNFKVYDGKNSSDVKSKAIYKYAQRLNSNQVNQSTTTIQLSKGMSPRYWLVASLASVTANDNPPAQLMDTSRYTTSLGLDVMINFSFIDTATGSLVDSFVIEAVGSDTKILSSQYQTVTYNYNKIIKEAVDSLSSQVSDRLEDVQNFVAPPAQESNVGK